MTDGSSTRAEIYAELDRLFQKDKLAAAGAVPPPPPDSSKAADLKEPGGKDGATPTSAAADSAAPVATLGTEDAPEVALARAIVTHKVEQAFEAAVVDVRVAKVVCAAEGIEFGVDDDGNPAFTTKDGTEFQLSIKSLADMGFPEILLKPLGRPGTGIVDGGKAWTPPDLEAGLGSQAVWDANRRAMLQEYSRRKGRK